MSDFGSETRPTFGGTPFQGFLCLFLIGLARTCLSRVNGTGKAGTCTEARVDQYGDLRIQPPNPAIQKGPFLGFFEGEIVQGRFFPVDLDHAVKERAVDILGCSVTSPGTLHPLDKMAEDAHC